MEMRDAPPAHLLIEIQSFSKLSKQESREFVARNYRWRLAIFPTECDHISVYLCVAEAEIDTLDVPVNANCSIFLHNQISDNYLCYRRKAVKFDAVNWKWRFSMSKRTLCNVDDELVFGAEVFVSETTHDTNECLCLFDFKISDFSKLKGVWYSQVLRVGGLRWKVMVYPNGDKSSRGQSVSIYLMKIYLHKHYNHHQFDKMSQCIGKLMGLLPAPVDDKEFTLETRKISPAHLIQIKSFSKLSEHGIRKLESPEFEAGDYKWKVVIYLDRGEYICVNLSMVGSDSVAEVNAIFNVFLYNHISDNYLCFRGKAQRFHGLNSECGYSKLISKKRLRDPCNGYVMKDKCVFGAEVLVVEKQQRVIENVSVLYKSNAFKKEWKIPQYSNPVDVWNSKEFSVGGYNWKIQLYPNGDLKGKGRYVSVYLECASAKTFPHHKKVNVFCSFCFKTRIPGWNLPRTVALWFTSITPSWGFSEFKALDDMRDSSKGFLVDNSWLLEIQLSVRATQQATI